MNAETFNRLHSIRMENDAARYAQEELKPRFDRMANRHENGTAPRAVTAWQLFQTPPEIATQLVAALNLKPGARVLEPSAGLGRILDSLKPAQPAEVVAVEINKDLCRELFQQERTGVTIKQRDFLTLTVADIGTFDAVVMNPPFHMRADIAHIQHALKFLRAGGRLVTLCMDTEHRQKAFQPIASEWIDLPDGSFAGSGTNVKTAMAVIEADGIIDLAVTLV